MGVHICTIAARNYLPFVRTLATSFREVHPDGRVSALIFDDIDCVVGPGEPFEVLRLADLGEDVGELHRMAMIYDVTELATALKPWLLEALLGRGSDAVLYLDPDIQVFSSLQPLADAAVAHGIALTPHVDTPFPLDDRKTEDRAILAAGIYNLGFIGVARTAQPFLDYWKERLRRECRVDPQNMRFVDQRWVDFVPGLFDHVIVRDPQYNVAYWNLHGRTLAWTGAGYEVNGRPLAFYHFSGYSPFARHLLSRHQGDRPRILLSEHPDLSRLCDQYADRLLRNGAAAVRGIEYGFDRMADGTPIDQVMRQLYRDWLEEAEDPETVPVELPPDPFERAGAAELTVRLNEPPDVVGDPGRLTCYLAALHASRPDLRAAFPDPQWADHDRFMGWVVDESLNGDIPALLAREPAPRDGEVTAGGPPVAGSVAGEWAPGDRLRPGIVVAGYLNAELGIGEGARLTVDAVAASGVPFTTVGYRATNSRQLHPFAVTGASARDLDTNVVVVNADQFAHFASEAGSSFFAGRYTIAQWAWELEEFPRQYWPVLDLVSEVWAVSEFARSAIAAVTDKPVLAFPHPIVPPVVDDRIDRAAVGLPEGFVFLFCFDLFSVLERKNPLGLIEAFCRAFEPGEGPTLVLKAINGATCVNELEHLRWAMRGRKDIVLLDRYLDHDEQAALMALCDCYVSLHRSEGFGLTMAEAMALGKPVIATAYSGNLDFMDASTAYLVPTTMTPVPKGCDPYPAGAEWADPDLGEAARLMRAVVEHPDAAAAVGQRARKSVLSNHSVERRAEFVRRRFDEIQRKRAALIEADRADAMRASSQRSRSRQLLARARSTVERVTGPVGHLDAVHPVPTHDAVAGLREAGEGVSAVVDRELRDDVTRLRRHVELVQHSILEREVALGRHLSHASVRQDELERTVERLDARLAGRSGLAVSFDQVQASVAALRAVPDTGHPPAFQVVDELGREAIGFDTGAEGSDGYAGFEDVFRGSEDLIRGRLRRYLPELAGHSPIVDVGCGRGEMLDLLAEAGTPGIGIDLDESMVERTRAKGHEVVHGDAIAVLRERPAGSVGAVVSFQLVEHLWSDQIAALLVEARRVLVPDGIFIAETVNPHALQAFKTFWTDLTHRTPIFPEVLAAQCREAGFASARVEFQGGSGVLAEDRFTCGDYAIIARNPPAPKR